MGQTGEGKVQWETPGGELTTTTYIEVKATTAAVGTTKADKEL